MTSEQRQSLATYTSEMAVELGLTDWTLDFPNDEPSIEDAIASVDPVYGRKRATIRFRRDFMHCPPEEQRQTVIHELVHLHFAAQTQAVVDALKPLGMTAELAADYYQLTHEYAVDALAEAIARYFPLWEGE